MPNTISSDWPQSYAEMQLQRLSRYAMEQMAHWRVLCMRSLAIDDEFVALSKMVTLLEPFGQCDAATSSQQALELYRKALQEGCPYALVTIDINLPDTNGIALLERLHSEERRRGARRAWKLMVTAESTASNVLAAASGECDGFLVKPVRRAVLVRKLATLGLLPESIAAQAEDGSAEIR
jgi:two-component system chemotaxis response regulator CheY